MRKLTQEEVIKRFIEVHGNKYDYSKVVYLSMHIKVIIICPIHGEFEQIPSAHLQGQGCHKCFLYTIKLTLEEFVKRSRLVHNNKYSYKNFIYINNRIKGWITCEDHGDFEQTPDNHLQGQGCPKCRIKKLSNIFISSIDQFIVKARTIHGDKYDYNNFIYTGNKNKGWITCNDHGDFEQTPNRHLKGCGCPKCGLEKLSILFKSNIEEFINKAKEVHNNLYGYNNFIYINSWTKSWITCEYHGNFLQIPASHLQGHGCPKCNYSKGEIALEEIFKKHNIKYEPQYNIPEIVANYEIDFYLPGYRLLVEFHGKQHYEYIPFFHDGDYSFDDQKTRDDMVRDAARRWKYNYLEFNYKQFEFMTKKQFEELVINKIKKFM